MEHFVICYLVGEATSICALNTLLLIALVHMQVLNLRLGRMAWMKCKSPSVVLFPVPLARVLLCYDLALLLFDLESHFIRLISFSSGDIL